MSIPVHSPLQSDRNLAIEMVRITEASALAAAMLTGRGDEKAVDIAASNAMQAALNGMELNGTIVNGQSDDPSHPLHTGETVGSGQGPVVDIALTAIEGATVCAKGAHNALSVVALTEGGAFLKVPEHIYMEKIAAGPGLPPGTLDLAAGPEANLARVAAARGIGIADLSVCVLDRPRHADLIGRLYEAGARVVLIDDGDVSGALAAGLADTGIDLYMGSGGAAQGVLAAAGLKCLGGQMQCRLTARSEAERARARLAGITDFERVYDLDDLVRGEVMFAATGITDGHVLKGVRLSATRAVSHSVVMRSVSGTVRHLTVFHDLTKHK